MDEVFDLVDWNIIRTVSFIAVPFLLPKGISYVQRLRRGPSAPVPANNRAAPATPKKPSFQRLPRPALLAVLLLTAAAAGLYSLGGEWNRVENVFVATQSRLQIPTDVLFNRLSGLRPNHTLTDDDRALKARFVNLESRLLYLQFGPDILAHCPFCSSDNPLTYMAYAIPSLLAIHIANAFVLSLATTLAGSSPGSGSRCLDGQSPRWRNPVAIAAAVVAVADLVYVQAWNYQSNSRATRLADVEMFFWDTEEWRGPIIGFLDVCVALLIVLTSTNLLLARPPTSAERVDDAARRVRAIQGRLGATAVIHNATVRDDDLRQNLADYWAVESRAMRDAMADGEVAAGVADALESRLNIEKISQDADHFVDHIMPLLTKTGGIDAAAVAAAEQVKEQAKEQQAGAEDAQLRQRQVGQIA